MKRLLYVILFFSYIITYGQQSTLPENIDKAFHAKYSKAKLDDWWFEKDRYYINFSVNPNSYTAVYDQSGEWQETAEIISDFDIPSNLTYYLKQNYPEGKISYCEKVETRNNLKFIRLNFYNKNQLLIIQCDNMGKNIKKLEDENQ